MGFGGMAISEYVLNFEVFVYFYPFLENGLQKLNREGNKFPGEI